jgi:hypothetical protein
MKVIVPTCLFMQAQEKLEESTNVCVAKVAAGSEELRAATLCWYVT